MLESENFVIKIQLVFLERTNYACPRSPYWVAIARKSFSYFFFFFFFFWGGGGGGYFLLKKSVIMFENMESKQTFLLLYTFYIYIYET